MDTGVRECISNSQPNKFSAVLRSAWKQNRLFTSHILFSYVKYKVSYSANAPCY